MRTNIDDDDDDNRTTIINDNEEAKAEVRDRSRRQRGLRCGVCSTCFHCACACVCCCCRWLNILSLSLSVVTVYIIKSHASLIRNVVTCYTRQTRLSRLRRNYCCHRVFPQRTWQKKTLACSPSISLSPSLCLTYINTYMSYTCNVNNIAALNESIWKSLSSPYVSGCPYNPAPYQHSLTEQAPTHNHKKKILLLLPVQQLSSF